MPKQLSAVTILQEVEHPNRFILIRADSPDMDRQFVWCGKANGWQPWNATTELIAKTFRTEDDAKRAANKAVTFTLQE